MKRILSAILSLTITFNLSAQKSFNEPSKILSNHTEDVDAVAISYSSNLMASASLDKTIKLYKAESPFGLIRELTGHNAAVTALCFNKTGKLLASGSSDNVVKVWDSLFRVKDFIGHKGKINCLLFDKDMRHLYSGSDDKTIIIWDVVTGKIFKTINVGQQVNSLAMTSDDSHLLYVATDDQSIKVYDISKQEVDRTFDGHAAAINSIDISNDSKYLISGSNDKSARIWEASSGKELLKLKTDCWKIISVTFSDDSKLAATGCNDGSVKVWEVESGKLVSTLEFYGNGTKQIVFSKDAQNIIVANSLRGSDQFGLRVWQTDVSGFYVKEKEEKIKLAKADSIRLAAKAIVSSKKVLKAPPVKKVLTKTDSLNLKLSPKALPKTSAKPLPNKLTVALPQTDTLKANTLSKSDSSAVKTLPTKKVYTKADSIRLHILPAPRMKK